MRWLPKTMPAEAGDETGIGDEAYKVALLTDALMRVTGRHMPLPAKPLLMGTFFALAEVIEDIALQNPEAPECRDEQLQECIRLLEKMRKQKPKPAAMPAPAKDLN